MEDRMTGTRKLGISEESELSAERMAQAIYDGKIKQHLLRNTYQVQQGTLEFSFEILKLNGSDIYE